MMEVTGSIEAECERRLTNLYNESHGWLLQVAYKITKHREASEDIVGELYEYLHLKKNTKLFWGQDSYNLLYCSKFIKCYNCHLTMIMLELEVLLYLTNFD